MSPVQGLDELACRFAKDAEFARSAAMRELERSVCGCDYGSTSWTTRVEAERIAQLLELRRNGKLLDVGAGSGWPGLYLAQLTGCNVVLVGVSLANLSDVEEGSVAIRRCPNWHRPRQHDPPSFKEPPDT